MPRSYSPRNANIRRGSERRSTSVAFDNLAASRHKNAPCGFHIPTKDPTHDR